MHVHAHASLCVYHLQKNTKREPNKQTTKQLISPDARLEGRDFFGRPRINRVGATQWRQQQIYCRVLHGMTSKVEKSEVVAM
jgi:hypothetical protein